MTAVGKACGGTYKVMGKTFEKVDAMEEDEEEG